MNSFSEALSRFNSEVAQALTTARRAARDAKAESAEFRRRTEELGEQAKSGKLRGLRRAQVAPTTEQARADATKFRVDNGLPVTELPTAAELMARLPNREPAPPVVVAENDDFSQHQLLLDVDEQEPREDVPAEAEDESEELPPRSSGEPSDALPSDADEDFSQQRILMDATVESYRPDQPQDVIGAESEPENRR